MMYEAIILAHMAVSGWQYDASCCSGKDCVMIPADRVEFKDPKYIIKLKEGDHPFANTEPKEVHEKQVKVSGDQNYHLCASRYSVYCLYVPGGGA